MKAYSGNSIRAALDSSSLMRTLTEEQRDHLALHSRMAKCPRGEVI